MSPEIQSYCTQYGITLTIREGLYAAQIETSFIADEHAQKALAGWGYHTDKTNWHFFNRLIVPVKLQGKGYASELLSRLSTEIKANNINVLLQASAYGNMTQDKLELLYLGHGFKRVKDNAFIQEC